MPKFLVTWLLTALALILTAQFVPGLHLGGFGDAIVGAAMLGFVNAIVRPILFVLTLPLTLVTLGLFLPVLNVLALIIVDKLTPGLTLDNFWAAVLGAIVLALVSGLLTGLAQQEEAL
jgi:putative membrane protein